MEVLAFSECFFFYLTISDYKDHECIRPCNANAVTCKYDFRSSKAWRCLRSLNAFFFNLTISDYKEHECIRPCNADAGAMTCKYDFTVENYQVLPRACYNCYQGNKQDCLREHCVTANGYNRNIKTVNRGLPGPSIQVSVSYKTDDDDDVHF